MLTSELLSCLGKTNARSFSGRSETLIPTHRNKGILTPEAIVARCGPYVSFFGVTHDSRCTGIRRFRTGSRIVPKKSRSVSKNALSQPDKPEAVLYRLVPEKVTRLPLVVRSSEWIIGCLSKQNVGNRRRRRKRTCHSLLLPLPSLSTVLCFWHRICISRVFI